MAGGFPEGLPSDLQNEVDEDALSTITEITEPDRISNSNRSLHSSSSSVATKASGEDLDEDNIRSLDSTLQGIIFSCSSSRP